MLLFRALPALRLAVLLIAASAAFCPVALAGHAAATPHPANGSSALVVDVQRVLRESLAAKGVQKQLDSQRATFQTETESEENELRHAEQDLVKSRDQIDAKTYAEREKQLRQRFLTVERHVEARRKALDETFTESMDKVRKALIEVVEIVAQSRGAKAVLVKQQVLWMDPTLDATDEVLAKLNAKLAKVPMKPDIPQDDASPQSLPLQNRPAPSIIKRP